MQYNFPIQWRKSRFLPARDLNVVRNILKKEKESEKKKKEEEIEEEIDERKKKGKKEKEKRLQINKKIDVVSTFIPKKSDHMLLRSTVLSIK